MPTRSIKTGLSKKYKDMLSAVKGQMCDGYWENTPAMQGYWRFCKIGTAGDEVTIEVDGADGARVGDRFIENRFYGMSDDAVKKFFADKIKFLIKEEGLGRWDRGNENETDFLSYGSPSYRVKDCYYAYEILKGRDARRHPEYGDVAESNMKPFGAKRRANEKRVMDTSEPYELSQIKEYMAKKGWAWNFNDKNNHFWFTKNGGSRIEGDLIPWAAYILSKDGTFYFGRSLRNWKADMKAAGINEACDASNEAFDGWDGWEEIEGLEDALDGIENLAYELRSCVRGAKTRCKDWKALARHIQNLASQLDDAAGEMKYRQDESEKENGGN